MKCQALFNLKKKKKKKVISAAFVISALWVRIAMILHLKFLITFLIKGNMLENGVFVSCICSYM